MDWRSPRGEKAIGRNIREESRQLYYSMVPHDERLSRAKSAFDLKALIRDIDSVVRDLNLTIVTRSHAARIGKIAEKRLAEIEKHSN